MATALPDSDSYREYKADTSIFLSGIADAAKACGHVPKLTLVTVNKDKQSAPQTLPNDAENQAEGQGRLKGKAWTAAKKLEKTPKAAKFATSSQEDSSIQTKVVKIYKVTVAEILRQRAARRAIALRERFAVAFHEYDKQTSNHGHQYFITVLKQAYASLGSSHCFEELQTVPEVSEHAIPMFANKFGHLELEEPLEAQTQEPFAAKVAVKDQPKSQARALEPEVNDEEELEFKYFCFFQDLHKLQGYIRGLTVRYKDGELDDLTFLTVINAAVEYARQQELVLVENVLEHLRHSTERPEPIFVSLRKKGIKLEPNSEGESQSFPRQRNARFRETRFSLLRFAAEAVKKDNFYFIEVPQLGKDGNVDPELALHREWEEEHTFLVQYMNELILEDIMRKKRIEQEKRSGPSAIGYDQISQLLKIFTDAEAGKVRVQMSSIFAADVLLDTRAICKKKDDFWVTELNDAAAMVSSSLDGILKTCERAHPNEYYVEGRLRQQYHFISAPETSWKRWMYLERLASQPVWHAITGQPVGLPQTDALRVELRKVASMIPYDSEECRDCVQPAVSGVFLRRSNPLLCATLKLDLLLDFQEFGLGFANAHGHLVVMSHLFNALKATDCVQGEWPALQEIMDTHRKEIFLNELPKDTLDMFTRFCHTAGMSAVAIAKLKKEGPSADLKKSKSLRHTKDRQAWDLVSNTTCTAFRKAFAGKVSTGQLIATLSEQVQRHRERIAGMKPAKYADRNMDTTKLMAGLCNFLPSAFAPLSTDLVTLTRTCGALLRDIDNAHDTLNHKPLVDSDSWLTPSMNSFAPVLTVLSSIVELDDLQQAAKGRINISESPYITPATAVISAYLRNGATGVPREPSEPKKRAIQYNFGSGGATARNQADGTPWPFPGMDELKSKLNAGEFNETLRDMADRGMMGGEIDPAYLTKDTKFSL